MITPNNPQQQASHAIDGLAESNSAPHTRLSGQSMRHSFGSNLVTRFAAASTRSSRAVLKGLADLNKKEERGLVNNPNPVFLLALSTPWHATRMT